MNPVPTRHSRRFARFLSRAVLALSAARAAVAAEPVAIRLGTILPSGTPQHALLLELGERWRKDGGAAKLTVFADGRLGGEAEMVKKIRIKQINAGLFTVVGLSEIDPGVTGLQLIPLAFRSWTEVDHVREKLRPMLEARLRAKGFEVLCWADAGWVRFFSKQPGVRPDDFRPMKMFVWAGNEPQVAIMKSIGCRPVPLETADLMLGLNTDLINAAPLPPLVALAGQLYGPASHMLEMNWCPIVGAVIVRTDAWEKIPAATRDSLRTAADDIGGKIRARGRFEDEEAVRAMQQRGLKVHALPPAAAAEWDHLKTQLYARIRGVTVPAEIFDAVEQHLHNYRASGAGSQ
ncbi:MAG: TRAP transporter substrate-binding protein DctP [Verrucomicrobia bacterium]|nr:TRAP transporter substrate-binding protein DctP [Verrucomicrobiota bacterium]